MDGKLYEVSGFAKKHPGWSLNIFQNMTTLGGEKVLRKLAGTEINSYMKGLERVNDLKHEHSEAAYQILSRYSVDHRIEVC